MATNDMLIADTLNVISDAAARGHVGETIEDRSKIANASLAMIAEQIETLNEVLENFLRAYCVANNLDYESFRVE